MDIDIKELIKIATENLNLKDFKGDVVGFKYVENEIGNIEEGGIGVQKVYNGRGDDDNIARKESGVSQNPAGNEPKKPIVLSSSDNALLKRLLGYVKKCDWAIPASIENVTLWFRTLFGADTDRLDSEDVEDTGMFRDFFKSGKAGEGTERSVVSMANIIGYLMNYQLLVGGQKQICIQVFGDTIHVNNINKGKSNAANMDFKRLIPLMDKYREKIIGTRK